MRDAGDVSSNPNERAWSREEAPLEEGGDLSRRRRERHVEKEETTLLSTGGATQLATIRVRSACDISTTTPRLKRVRRSRRRGAHTLHRRRHTPRRSRAPSRWRSDSSSRRRWRRRTRAASSCVDRWRAPGRRPRPRRRTDAPSGRRCDARSTPSRSPRRTTSRRSSRDRRLPRRASPPSRRSSRRARRPRPEREATTLGGRPRAASPPRPAGRGPAATRAHPRRRRRGSRRRGGRARARARRPPSPPRRPPRAFPPRTSTEPPPSRATSSVEPSTRRAPSTRTIPSRSPHAPSTPDAPRSPSHEPPADASTSTSTSRPPTPSPNPPRDDDEFGDPDGDPEYFAPSRETRTSLDAAAAAEAEDDARLAEAADCTEAMAYRIKAAEAAAGSTAVRIRDAAEDASFAFAVGKGKNGVRRTERADHGTRTFDLDAGSADIVTVRGYVPESGSPANPSRPRPSSFARLPRRAHGPDDVRSFGDAPSFSPSFSPSAPLSPSPFARRVGPRTPAGALVDECLEETRFAAARDGERAARFEHPSPGSPPRRAWRRRRGGVEGGGDGSGRGGEKRGGGVGGVGDGSGRGYDALFPPIRGERATRPSPKRLGVDNAATVTATTWGRAAAATTNANVNADANGAPRWGTPEKLSGMKRTPSAAREVRLASVPRSPAASASRGTKDETTRARNQNSGGVESGLGLGFGFGSRLESRLGEGFGPRVRDDSRRNGEGRDDFFAVTERFRYGA